MTITENMKELLEKTMEQYFAAYWERHSTPEQEAKRVADGKTFKGAYHFAHTVAEHFRGKMNGENCVAMPDELAYWILMHYMEHEPEGAEYKTPEEIVAEKERALEREREKQRKLEEKAKAKNKGGALIPVTAEDIRKAEEESARNKADAKKIAADVKRIEEKAEADKSIAQSIEEKVEQMSLF